MRKIYSLEDDLSITKILNDALPSKGFDIRSFSDYRLFFDEIRKDKPDIILLDLTLPLISGEEVLKYLKGNLTMHNIPIIILSGNRDENELINCLDFGADDFMVKPFSILELISRINAILRRFGLRNDVIFDNIKITLGDRIVKIDGQVVELTYKEFDLLLYLIERFGIVVTKEELVKKFWSNNLVNSRSIDMHIMALRGKVFSKTKLEIHTILKVGYKLCYRE